MITPSFALTATERVLPKLALDFTTATLDPRITFTRSLNTATRINSSGYIENVLADTPRFDYNNLTLVCQGLLIEEQRTNLLRWGRDYSQAVWSLTGTGVSKTQNSGTNMYGGSTVWTINSSATAGAVFQQVITGTAGVNYTVSFWARRRSGSGTTINARVGDNVDYPLSGLTTDWKRFTYTAQSSTTTVRAGLSVPAGSMSVDIDCIQLELASFATSYIDTDGTVGGITRNADVATMTGTNFSSWYNASEGTFKTQSQTMSFAAARGIFAVGDPTKTFATSENMYSVFQTTTGNIVDNVLVGGVVQVGMVPTKTQTINTTSKNVFTYKLNSFAASTDASVVNTDNSGTIPTVTGLSLGSLAQAWSGSLGYLNGYVEKFYYWPQRLTNAEVQAFSK